MTKQLQIPEIRTEVKGLTGFISLNRPKALNALSLPMIRALMGQLLAWKDDAIVKQVAIRGMSKPTAEGVEVPFGNFSAGGDIRFFHQAIQTGNPELEDFFTEEYALNHLIANYPKPYIAFMDGLVFGGGMGISQGASHRIVTERTKMAMPETGIGLFPDVGGGYFLSRCPGFVGEYLALTGVQIGADEALAYGLADLKVSADALATLWESLESKFIAEIAINNIATKAINTPATVENITKIDTYFSLSTVSQIITALEASTEAWQQQTAATLRTRSPLMLHVVLEQIRRGRQLNLAQNLQMERGMVRHCFYTAHLGRFGNASETVEGIRALAVDKDHTPRWNPAHISEVTNDMVAPFFINPWPDYAHPLAHLTTHLTAHLG
ncbi:MAG: enoyl-CoA hydratase/isomerase family protein [Burkholderiaceae bacterium]